MKRKQNSILVISIALVLILTAMTILSACGGPAATTTAPAPAPSTSAAPPPTTSAKPAPPPATSAAPPPATTQSPPPTTSAPPPAAAKTLRIGYLLCISGWYSIFDAVEEGDVKIVAKLINDQGGLTIQGQKYNIELVGEDGKSSLDGCTAAANKLVDQDGVKFVVGPTGFFSTGSSPVFEAAKVMHVSGYITNQPGEMDATTPYGFTAFNCTVGTDIAIAKAMRKEYPNLKNVSIACVDDGQVPYTVPIYKKILQDQGFNVVGDTVLFTNDMQDFNPIAAKLNAIPNTDAYFMQNGAPPHAAGILKGLRSLGNSKPFGCQGAYQMSDIIAIAGKQAATDMLSLGVTPHAPGNPALMDKVYDMGKTPRVIYLFNPQGLWVLAQVIQAANSLDPAVVKAKWESMDTLDTLFGKGIFSGDQTYGLKHHAIGHPIQYQKLVNGEGQYGGWIDVGPIP
jgi:branched-chain amino acid transport system substrate-binding protein